MTSPPFWVGLFCGKTTVPDLEDFFNLVLNLYFGQE